MIKKPDIIKMTVFAADEAETQRFGAHLAQLITFPCVIALHGDLGMGKSTLVRGFIHSFTPEEVPSPTFTLVQTYTKGDLPIYHYDFYRLNVPDEALELNIDEAFSTGICFLEWPEKIGSYLPKKRLDITLSAYQQGRLIQVKQVGA